MILTYADDIFLYCDNSLRQFKQIRSALTAMKKTAVSSGFHFASQKTKAMWFSSRVNPEPQLMHNDLPIQWVNSFTYLGVVIDKGLRSHKHAQYLIYRVTIAVNVIRVLASLSGVNLNILRRFFNGTVRPILEYGSEVFCLMSASSIKSLQTAQNTALKKCLGVDNWTATDNVHRELNVLPVANRSELAQAKLAHDIIQNNKHTLQQYIDSELHPTQRRRHRLWGPRFAGALRKLCTPPATTTPDVVAPHIALTLHTTPRAKPPAPWTSIPVTVVLNNHLPSKHTTEAELLKTLTLATLDHGLPQEHINTIEPQ